MADRYEIIVKVEPDGDTITLKGRDAWALAQLVKAGAGGCTPIDTPGPRWSGYIYKLRKAGLVVETIHESHKGPFPGTHARYVLHSRVSVRQIEEAEH
jgi:hypothetical protein